MLLKPTMGDQVSSTAPARNNYGYAKNASDPEGCAASACGIGFAGFSGSWTRSRRDRPHSISTTPTHATALIGSPPKVRAAHHDERSDRNAVRALRRLKLFQMLRGDHRHVRNATSRPPSERRHEMPGRVAHFRNGGTPSVAKDGPIPRSSRVQIGRPPGRAAEQAALRDAFELVGGIHAAAARLRQASYRTPLRKLRDDQRARHSGFGTLA